MSFFFRAKEFIKYRFDAVNEFKVHSPFAYDFYTKVIKSHKRFPECLNVIEKIRKDNIRSNEVITVLDMGAGSSQKRQDRKISDIMKHCSVTKKDAFLLYRIVNYIKPAGIIELGTSLGISSMYMATASPHTPLTTIEACPQTAAVAQKNFDRLNIKVNLVVAGFDDGLPKILKAMGEAGLVFFDGNHTKEATLKYFGDCLHFANDKSIFIFHDIYWSPGMMEAWQEIYSHPQVTTSIDLHQMGVVFFNKKIHKQHFILKY